MAGEDIIMARPKDIKRVQVIGKVLKGKRGQIYF